jgi:hypothetical protein
VGREDRQFDVPTPQLAALAVFAWNVVMDAVWGDLAGQFTEQARRIERLDAADAAASLAKPGPHLIGAESQRADGP